MLVFVRFYAECSFPVIVFALVTLYFIKTLCMRNTTHNYMYQYSNDEDHLKTSRKLWFQFRTVSLRFWFCIITNSALITTTSAFRFNQLRFLQIIQAVPDPRRKPSVTNSARVFVVITANSNKTQDLRYKQWGDEHHRLTSSRQLHHRITNTQSQHKTSMLTHTH